MVKGEAPQGASPFTMPWRRAAHTTSTGHLVTTARTSRADRMR